MEKTALINDALQAACTSLQQTRWYLCVDRRPYVSRLGALQLQVINAEQIMLDFPAPDTAALAKLFADMPPVPADLLATDMGQVFDRYDTYLHFVPVNVTATYDTEQIALLASWWQYPINSQSTLVDIVKGMPVKLEITAGNCTITRQPGPLAVLMSPAKLTTCVSASGLEKYIAARLTARE